jgi:hypothetical protein
MTVYTDHITHYCYRLRAEIGYDPELVWADIQDKDGYLSIGVAGDVYFWIPTLHRDFFVLKYPLLERDSGRDLL